MNKKSAVAGGTIAVVLVLTSPTVTKARDNADRVDRSQRLDSDSIRNDVREERLTIPQHPLFPQPSQAEPSAKAKAKSKRSTQR
jgi:hypothetical protein